MASRDGTTNAAFGASANLNRAALTESFVPLNGIRLHAMSAGPAQGRLVILLHGFPEFWYSWRYVMPALADAGFRVVAPDLRGYNLSDKPRGIENYHVHLLARDVRELIRACGAESAFVVGHDWGAIVAWRAAMKYPDVVARLAILNVPHPGKYRAALLNPRQMLRSQYIGFFQIPRLPELLLSRFPRWTARGIRASMVRRAAMPDADLEKYARAIAQPGAMRAAINYYRAFLRWDMWLPVKPIHAPTLMIWGENDVALGKELTYGTEKFVRDFRIYYLPRCGHWVQQEAAREVNELLLDFFSG
jgi:pimeloyl-ACP methyl ester carboxylesterase